LIAANMVLANAKLVIGNLAGVILWGLNLGITQGLFAMMIANAAPVHLRATAFGVFGLIGGVMALFASIIAGFLWYQLGSSFPFYSSMVFASIVIVMVLIYPRLKKA
jgi:MFS family permease